MKWIGLLVIAAGIGWTVFAYRMPSYITPEEMHQELSQLDLGGVSTFATTPKMPVYNLGRAETRRIQLELGALTVLIGTLLFGFGAVIEQLAAMTVAAEPERPISDNQKLERVEPVAGAQSEYRMCPSCRSLNVVDATECSSCGKALMV